MQLQGLELQLLAFNTYPNMKNTIYLILCVGIMSCTNPRQSENDVNDHCLNKVDITAWKQEFLDIDSMKINGLGYLSSKNEVFNLLGDPDQINSIPRETSFASRFLDDNGSPIYEYYFGGTIFEGNDKEVFPRRIDFEQTNLIVEVSGTKLYHGMSLRDLFEKFPEACKLLIRNNGNAWSGHIEVGADKSGSGVQRVFLVFKGEELVRIEIISLLRT
jgi:hypothetical protein